MSAKESNIIKSLLKSIRESGERQTYAYDSEAKVVRVEDGTAWVHIPGGADETPVKLTINAVAGDTVQVRISGGRAFMVGNASAPPTDDRVAKQAVKQVGILNKTVNAVKKVADSAARIAGNTNQYFWHTESGEDTGAHITEVPREEFLADPENGGGNLLARSVGIAIRKGLKELATFGVNGSTIGETDKAHLELDYHSLKGVDKEGGAYFYVSDLRNEQGIATITMSFEVTESMSGTYNLFLTPFEIQSVTVNGVATSDYTLSGTNLTINTYGGSATPSAHDEVKIIFTTKDRKAKAYTLGNRKTSAETGPMSHAEGNNNEATFYCAHAEGANNSAYGACSHAEGGANSAIGNYSHVGGAYCWAYDYAGFAHGLHVLAQNPYEAVFGKYNEKDPLKKFIFAVGNGTSESNRKNALSLTKDGALETSAVRRYAPEWETGYEADEGNTYCVVSAGMCTLTYMSAAISAMSAGDLLGTLPEGARPWRRTYAPFAFNNQGSGTVRIATDGKITLGWTPPLTAQGRIYFNVTYPVKTGYAYADNNIFN